MFEETVEDDDGENCNWLVRLTEQDIAARRRIEARWARQTNLYGSLATQQPRQPTTSAYGLAQLETVETAL
jgi:hypothetical protein